MAKQVWKKISGSLLALTLGVSLYNPAHAAAAAAPTETKPAMDPNVAKFLRDADSALKTGDLKTVGEIREASDAMLLSTQNLGKASVAYLRQSLGLRSTGGVRPDKLS